MRVWLQRVAVLSVMALGMFAAPAWAEGKIGVVLMHGKWSNGIPLIASLADRLRAEGYLVSTPEMPWSARRMYDVSYDDALSEIDRAVQSLRNKGADRIVVAGHSLGANAALGYGARREGLSGIIALAPGHTPELPSMKERYVSDVAHARALVAAGQGDQWVTYMDINQGKSRTVSVSARVFLSYCDPEGPAVMPDNAAKLTAPLLWIVGNDDKMSDRGEGYAFAKAPAQPLNRYVQVNAGHMETPTVAAGDVVTWLKQVAAQ